MALRLAAACAIVICLASFISSQATPQRVRVSENVEQAFIVKKVDPVYPPLALQARIQGSVVLQVAISKSGDVENVQLFGGRPLLAPAAIDAVKQWKYKPYLLNGEPVEVETRVAVDFTLPEKRPVEGVVGDAPGGIPPGEQGGMASALDDANHPRRVRVSQRVMAARLLTKVPPEYPAAAKDQRVQGEVLMAAVIDREGRVSSIQLISGHPLLAPAAIDAVKQWKYRPYLLNGEPIEIETQITVNFSLAR